MKKVSLMQFLKDETFAIRIRGNLHLDSAEYDAAVQKVDALGDSNVVAVRIDTTTGKCDFECSLHENTDKDIYLLECRLFRESGCMVGTYLEVVNSKQEIVEEGIDDVWTYANWSSLA